MKSSAKTGMALAALAVVGAGFYAVPQLFDNGAGPATEQRLRGEPGRGEADAPAGVAGKPFVLVATGDIIPYPSIVQRSADDAGKAGEYDFRKILAGVKPLISAADLAICHHEIPYGRPGGPYTGYPTFKAPHQLADALGDAGYDSCSTASNHTLDDGYEGLARTLEHLDRVGIQHVGSARSAEEAKAPALLGAGGAKIAQLSYTYGTNGIPLPPGKPWAVNLIDEDRILADARAARAGARTWWCSASTGAPSGRRRPMNSRRHWRRR